MHGFETILPFLKPIEHLILDESVSEVMVNGPDRVFIERDGFVQQVPGISLGDRALTVAVKNIARRLGDDVSESKHLCLRALQKKLDDRVKEVRLSSRLTSSPACLVVSEHDVSPNLEKLLNQAKGEGTKQKRIMELNPDHEIIAKMRDRAEDAMLDDFAEVLYGYALLAEGSELQDPLKFNQAVMRVLAKTI